MIHPLQKAKRAAKGLVKRFSATGVVLMYHRVAPYAIDPWDLNVTPEHFDQQLAILKKHTQPLRLTELASALVQRRLPDRFSIVTFDDGYANNLHYAKPLLVRHAVPATVFISTGYTGQQREYWWEELDDLLLSPHILPEQLNLNLGGHYYTWSLGLAAKPYNDPTHRQPDPVRDARLRFYFEVWQPLQRISHAARVEALDTIRGWSGQPVSCRETHRAMTQPELLELIEGGWIDVGGHTVLHPFLPGLPADEQRDEIVHGKRQLQDMVGRSIDTFSYPFNSHTPQTEQIVREAGFVAACTGREESVWRRSDPVQLTRFAIENWDAHAFERRLLQWLR